jgi:hypothetical protein
MGVLLHAVLRLAGVDPVRVVGLARGLRREARGQMRRRHEEEGRRRMGPETGRMVVLILLGVGSIFLAAAMAALRDAPLAAAMVLVAAQGGAVFLRSAGEVVPLILGADDGPVLGWWPVTARELMVARGLLLMEGVLEATAAIGLIPLVTLAFVGKPPVVTAAGTAAALLLHAVTVAVTILLLVQGAARVMGRRRARRLLEVVGTTLIILLVNVGARGLGRLVRHIDDVSPWMLLALPTAWYGSWGALAQPSGPVLAGAALGLTVTAVLMAVGVRVLGSVGAEESAVRAARRGGRDWTLGIDRLVAPWLRGRDGKAVRLLLRAHLREDWRFTGSLLVIPAALLFYLLVVRDEAVASMARGEGSVVMASSMLSLWMSILGMSLAATVACSAEPDASWLLRGSTLDAGRALSLQRRLLRSLVPGPLLGSAAVLLGIRLGMTPWQVLLSVAPAWLAFEIMTVFMQMAVPAASFSRAWRRDGGGTRHFFWLAAAVGPVAVVPAMTLYGQPGWGAPAVLASQALVLLLLRWALRWRAARLGVLGLAPRR